MLAIFSNTRLLLHGFRSGSEAYVRVSAEPKGKVSADFGVTDGLGQQSFELSSLGPIVRRATWKPTRSVKRGFRTCSAVAMPG